MNFPTPSEAAIVNLQINEETYREVKDSVIQKLFECYNVNGFLVELSFQEKLFVTRIIVDMEKAGWSVTMPNFNARVLSIKVNK